MRYALALVACMATAAHAGSYEARWQLPTTNVDGTAIPTDGPGELARTVVQWSICRDGAFGARLGVLRYDVPTTTGVIEGLETAKQYCFRAAVENVGGERSGWSNVVQVVLGAEPVQPTDPMPGETPTPQPPVMLSQANIAWGVIDGSLEIAGMVEVGVPCDDRLAQVGDWEIWGVDSKHVRPFPGIASPDYYTLCTGSVRWPVEG